MTNANFLVEDAGRRYVVRIGDDIPVHQLLRFNEVAPSRAAQAAGLSPAVLYHEPGVLILDFIEGRTLTEADVRDPATLDRIVPVIRRCHREIPQVLRGPALMFWVFHVLRDYAWTLREGDSPHCADVADLLKTAAQLEETLGPVDIVYGHNDLLAGNLIDDGARIWLVDWDYAGFNTPLFDLGGLASNNEFTPDLEDRLLESYFERPVTDDLRRRLHAMRVASLMRETMWSMVSELHSDLDLDYEAYTAKNMGLLRVALSEYTKNWG
jgi:thiamine kinase-like enzyme